jgi:hypothetical protein
VLVDGEVARQVRGVVREDLGDDAHLFGRPGGLEAEEQDSGVGLAGLVDKVSEVLVR